MKKKTRKAKIKKAEYCDNWIGDFPPPRIAKELEEEEPEFPDEFKRIRAKSKSRQGRKR